MGRYGIDPALATQWLNGGMAVNDSEGGISSASRRWGLSKPDPNVDHRPVPNLMTYFTRAGYALPPSRAAADYLPSDIVAWNLGWASCTSAS